MADDDSTVIRPKQFARAPIANPKTRGRPKGTTVTASAASTARSPLFDRLRDQRDRLSKIESLIRTVMISQRDDEIDDIVDPDAVHTACALELAADLLNDVDDDLRQAINEVMAAS